MPPPPDVRLATVDDVPAIVDLLAAVAAEGRWLGTEAGFDREARATAIAASLAAGAADAPDGAPPWASFLIDDPDGRVDPAPDDPDGRVDEAIDDADGPRPRLVANLNITIEPYGVAHLGMMVADGHRGRGLGSALLAAAIDWARGGGAHKVSLEVWPDNEPALALYEKFGFEREGVLRDHYRRRDGTLRSSVVMGLLLAPAPEA